MILLAFVPFKVYNKSNFRGRLIHRNINKWDFLPPKIGVDLYTSSTYTPENTVIEIQFDASIESNKRKNKLMKKVAHIYM